MSSEDRRDSDTPKEASPDAAGEEREQMLDRSSVESALSELSPPAPAQPPSSPQPQPPAQAAEEPPERAAEEPPERAVEEPAGEAPVRLSMQDIERLSVKPSGRPSDPPAASSADDDSAPAQQARPSVPDTTALGNAMRALFDSRIASDMESDAKAEEAPAPVDTASLPAESAPAPAAGIEEPLGPPAAGQGEPSAGAPSEERALVEEGRSVGEEREAPATDEAPVEVSAAGAAADTGASGRARGIAVGITGLVAFSVTVAVWFAVAGWPTGGPSDGEAEPSPTGVVSSAPQLPEPGAREIEGEPAESEAAAVETETDGDEAEARRARRKRRARKARKERERRARELALTVALNRDQAGAAEGTQAVPQTGTVGTAPTEAPTPGEAPGSGVARDFADRPPGGKAAEAEKRGGSAPLSRVPDRESVKQAMENVLPEVQACTGGKHGVAEVVMTVKNTGRVTHAVVRGDFAGTQEGSCIARAVRKARLQPFLLSSFTLVYPFAL